MAILNNSTTVAGPIVQASAATLAAHTVRLQELQAAIANFVMVGSGIPASQVSGLSAAVAAVY